MIDIALLGIGYWGKKLQPYLKEQFNLKYICNSKSKPEWDIDAVVIATPNETHYSLAKEALLRGKHILVEKPLAETHRDCLELALLGINSVIMTDYHYTFSKSLRKADKDIEAIDITLNRTDRFEGRDAYQVLGSHALSILSMFAPLNSLEFQFKDGLVFKGSITGHIFVDLKAEKKTEVITYGKEIKTYHPTEPHNLRHVVKHFARAIKGEAKDNLPLSLNISRILEEYAKC